MSDPKHNPAETDALPVDRVERVGDYFKSLFVRSLKLGLDDGRRGERLWEEAPVRVDCRPVGDAAGDPGAGRQAEEESD